MPRAAGAPHGEGRAAGTLSLHPLRLVPPGHGHGASLSLYFQVRAGTSSPFPRKGLVWAVLVSAGDAQARSSQSVSRAPSLSLISCISLEFCSGAGQSPKPVQPNPFTSFVTTQGQQGFPHGVPGRVGVPTWHGHTLLSLVTGQRSHSSGPGGPLRPCLPPSGSHTPAVVPLQRLPHRACGQGESAEVTPRGATPWSHPVEPPWPSLTVPSSPAVRGRAV